MKTPNVDLLIDAGDLTLLKNRLDDDCERCDGAGVLHGTYCHCPRCKGTGRINERNICCIGWLPELEAGIIGGELTPWFESVEQLESHCRENLDKYRLMLFNEGLEEME